MKRRTKCYIYTRVSTAIQVDGYSLDAQKDKLRKYAEYEDMIVAAEYSDEGFSGKNIQGRLEFQTGYPMCLSLSCPASVATPLMSSIPCSLCRTSV